MMRFFKELVKLRPHIDPAARAQAELLFAEIKALHKSNDIEDLEKSLGKIHEADIKYPFCSNAVIYYRGEVGALIIKKEEEKKEFLNQEPKTFSKK